MTSFGSKSVIKVMLLIVAVGLTISIAVMIIQARTFDTGQPVLMTIPEPIPMSASSRVLIMGDTFWGRYIRDASLRSEEKYAYPFQGLDEFEKEKYNSWMANLECPITNSNLTSAQQEAALSFNCRPEFLEEAAKWFDVFSLANNHTDNRGGQVGLDTTREYLDEYDIQYYGHYDNAVMDELCEVIDLPFDIDYRYGIDREVSLPVAMCGYHGVFKLPTPEELNIISNYSEYFLTIVTPHIGQEYVASPGTYKVNMLRAMIDRGADMVVAAHPHWVQNTEVYKDKLIVYSMGNFIFDQQNSEELKRSAILDLTVVLDDSDELKKWLEADLKCGEFGDDCLVQAKQLGLKKPNFVFTYDIVSSLNTNYVTRLAPKAIHDGVLQRLNWQATLEQLR